MASSTSSSFLPLPLNGPTVSDLLAINPSLSPHRAAASLFPRPSLLRRLWLRFKIKDDLYHRQEPSPDQIELAFRSGRWSSLPNKLVRPSDLFLKIYADVLLCLQPNQLVGLVSPPLIGSCGVMPLTILSVIPHIIQHYYDCIVLANHEVLLATNYLQKSDSQRKICDALIELSNRIGARGQKNKVVVKLIYDRGNWKQAFKNHQPVLPNTDAWNEVGLPKMEDIPNLEFEVINFHRVLLGTFHAKFLVVDRRVALLNSNNIQDRPNIEMMIHLEGPIVDSFYDMFLISWSNQLNPSLPLLSKKSRTSGSSDGQKYSFASDNEFLRNIDVIKSAQDARATLHREAENDRIALAAQQQEGILNSSFANAVRDLMEDRRRARQQPDGPSAKPDDPPRSAPPSTTARFSNAVQALIEERRRAKATTSAAPAMRPSSANPSPSFAPPTEGPSSKKDGQTTTVSTLASKLSTDSPSTTAIGSSFELAEPSKPSLKTNLRNLAQTELLRRTGSTGSPANVFFNGAAQVGKHGGRGRAGKNRMRALSDALNAGTLRQAHANVSPDHDIGDFQPHTIHSPHGEFPIAMVNRPPHGLPGHHDIRVPQNAAWMAGFRYAKRKVFIQTPTLNSKPVVRMCVETAGRGVKVVLYLDLGFNDRGESIPFQGGTNQQVVIKMYKALAKVGKQENLVVYWYTGKDQIRPINAVLKSRNCHIKFMAIDDAVGIQGNGNQDTQSWFHSQEINVMIDSAQMIKEWMDALVANQNTEMYGRVDRDGVWRDEAGRTVDYYDSPKLVKRKKTARVGTGPEMAEVRLAPDVAASEGHASSVDSLALGSRER